MKFEYLQEKIPDINQTLTVRIMLPDGYEASDKHYPVLYHHDGQDIFRDEDALAGNSMQYEQYYKDYGKFLPEFIFVAIDCPGNRADRTRLYSPYVKHFDVQGKNFEPLIVGQGQEYLEWMIHSLKPLVDLKYRTLSSPEYTAIGGSSTGGLISTYALLHYPDVFTRGILMSSAYYIWYDLLSETLRQSTVGHIKTLYMDLGTNEYGRMTTAEQFIEGNEQVHKYLLEQRLTDKQLKYLVYLNDEHNQFCWRRRLPDAIRWIFKDII